MIRVEGVTRTFGSVTAVDDVTFTVEADQIVGFVGPNGAGKSTMLRMLSTFLRPTRGRIAVDGCDTVDQPLQVRRRIGYLPGDTPLYADMVVRDLVRFVAGAHGLTGAAGQAALARVVEVCGIGPILDLRVRQCSTGFRQRLGLAIAMVHDPPVLLLDEPTHGFDPLQVMSFRQQLRSLKTGKAILFSTHIIADVEAVSDRVLVIHQGRLLGDGTLDELGAAAGRPGADLETIFARLVSASTASAGAAS